METYDEFINNILNTRGRFGCGDAYHERHHIIPKCCGGTNDKDNLIDLYAREHFIAHKLLAEENPDNTKLVYAWWCMSVQTNEYTKERYKITAEEYEAAKEIYSKTSSKNRSGENNPMFGKHHNEETCIHWSKLRKGKSTGKDNPNYGNYWTDEQKKYMSEVKSNLSKEVREKLSKSAKKRFENPEERKKISQSRKGKYTGENHPRAKFVLCIETKHIYKTTLSAAEDANVDVAGIRKCCNGKAKTAGGYQWKYIYDITRKDGTVIFGAIALGLITEQEVQERLNKKINTNNTK